MSDTVANDIGYRLRRIISILALVEEKPDRDYVYEFRAPTLAKNSWSIGIKTDKVVASTEGSSFSACVDSLEGEIEQRAHDFLQREDAKRKRVSHALGTVA